MKTYSILLIITIASISRAIALPLNTPTSGLVGYWSGEGNTLDSSPTLNNGIGYSGSYSAGILGQGFDFTGGGFATFSDRPEYDFTAAMTASFWFNGLGPGLNVFIGQDDGAGTHPKWFIDYDRGAGGPFEIHTNGPSFGIMLSNPVSVGSGWNHLAVTKDGTNYSFYLNGSFIGLTSFGGAFANPGSPLRFGFAETGFGGEYFGYKGELDEIALYNRALTAPEIATLARRPVNEPVPEQMSTSRLLKKSATSG